jgi:hypothetical protein
VLPLKLAKTASARELADYQQLQAQRNIHCVGFQRLEALRQDRGQKGISINLIID